MTKIIATIGPASENEDIIKHLILAGVNIFRFNTKHNTNEWHRKTIHKVRKVAESVGIPIGILVDLQGPEIRLNTLNDNTFNLKDGEKLELVSDFEKRHTDVCIKVPELVVNTLEAGDKFSIDDGFNDFEVVESYKSYVLAVALEDCVVKNRKGLNLLGTDIDLPSLTDADRERLSMVHEAKTDFIALSFVRTGDDIRALRHAMSQHKVNARVVSKIESQKGVDNIDEILELSDVIMIARGDLGIEIPLEQVPHIQKELIKKCRNLSTPVIVATQMLQSMIDQPRPTRAEVADVANAVYDESDCVMLSGETASGKYPVKAVHTMKKILKYNESKKTPYTFIPHSHDQTHLIANAAVAILRDRHEIKIDKILVFTETGFTANILSSYRPNLPVIALTDSMETVGALTINYGVVPFYTKFGSGDYTYPREIIDTLLETEILSKNSTVLILHGKRWKEPGGTNALVVVNL